MMMVTYFSVTTIISAQNTSDRMPRIVSWFPIRPKCGENASFSVYSGLVPMSPNTTPIAPSTMVRRPDLPSPCASRGLSDCNLDMRGVFLSVLSGARTVALCG